MKPSKSQTSQRKLKLNKHTLRLLDRSQTANVVGGYETWKNCPRELNTVQDPCYG
jgi:hypothetical protein